MQVARSGDASGDPAGDGRWLSYDELAKARRISKASAERLVFRNHWRRQKGNDRTVRALVPLDFLTGDLPPDASGDAPPDVSPDTRDLFAGALTAMEDALATLRAQLEGANRRAEHAEQGREGERQRADALRERIEGLAAELEVSRAGLEAELAAARRETRAAQDRAETLKAAETDRKARGLLARLRAAVRGE